MRARLLATGLALVLACGPEREGASSDGAEDSTTGGTTSDGTGVISVECEGAELPGSHLAYVDESGPDYVIVITSRQSSCADAPGVGWELRFTFPGGQPAPGAYDSLDEGGPELQVGWIESDDDTLHAGGGQLFICAVDGDGVVDGAVSVRFTTPLDEMFVYGAFSTTSCAAP